jgi:peptidoglycan/LPS O-acetylase OafA/YrhL
VSARFDVASRNCGIDIIRGISILLVILLHINIRIPIKNTELGSLLPKRIIWTFFTMGYEAVFMFFVISGFLITTNILRRSGCISHLDVKAFYVHRAGRIFPCLVLLVGLLSALAFFGYSQYRLFTPSATITGAAAAALGFYMNVYLSFVSPLPPSWDVLWSLSIEEVFYLAFPLLCLAARWWRSGVLGTLTILALALPVFHSLVTGTNETWAEKSYGPGTSSIAVGVLAAHFVRHNWARAMALPLLCAGITILIAALAWQDKTVSIVGAGGDLFLIAVGTAALLISFSAQPPAQRRLKMFLWLAPLGRRSYEIYLTHMFVVLAGVSLFRQFGSVIQYGYLWYPPIVCVAAFLGIIVARFISDRLNSFVRRKVI